MNLSLFSALRRTLFILIGLLGLSFATTLSAQPADDIEVSFTPAQEAATAAELLQLDPYTLVVRVEGLICETCGFGIYVKLRRTDGVDNSRFENGGKIDIYSQFLIVALEPDEAVAVEDIIEAVYDAGYDPVSLYMLADGAASGEAYSVPGVTSTFSLAEGSLDIEGDQIIGLRVQGEDATSFEVTLSPAS